MIKFKEMISSVSVVYSIYFPPCCVQVPVSSFIKNKLVWLEKDLVTGGKKI